MAPTLYKLDPSPPVRSVYIVAKAIDLELNLKDVDLFNKEHLSPEFLKLNPTHTIPVLVDDDGFTLWDSHAILTYLVEKYGKGSHSSLYPADLKKRAIVNQRLHFDSSTLFQRGLAITKRVFFFGEKQVPTDRREALEEAFGFVETFLQNANYVAGDEPTVADISIYTTITSFSVIVPIEESKYPKIAAWLKRMEALPYTSVNKKGNDELFEMYKKATA